MRFSFFHNQKIKTFLRRDLFPVLLFLAGVGTGWLAESRMKSNMSQAAYPLRASSASFHFINPLIGFDISQTQDFSEFTRLKTRVNDFLDNYTAEKKLIESAVYFRNLQNGHWFGIRENDEFDPGSLLKVPIMIAYLKWAEKNSGILSEQVLYSDPNASATEPPNAKKSILVKNQPYTIENLIRAMVVESDNGAKNILIDYINPHYVDEVFSDIGAPALRGAGGISPKTFASFFRRLFNATFLNRELSEYALTLLSKTSFKDGIVAGVPEGTAVAHKYGERGVYEENRLIGVELHDCGIIYYREGPRLLCVMTQGYDETTLKEVIRGVAEIVSDEIEKQ